MSASVWNMSAVSNGTNAAASRFLHCIIIIVLSSLSKVQSNLDLVEVNTAVGPIVGFRHQYDLDRNLYTNLSKTVDIFLGIPYGEAPIGDHRFRKPRAKEPRTEPWNATFDRPICWQASIDIPGLPPQDEDCLYLNIWRPSGQGEGLPVMVWIYGGAFVLGSGSGPVYDGSVLAAYNDVIVVTLNYRLSVFGFLYAGKVGTDTDNSQIIRSRLHQLFALNSASTASPGNYGIWDQNLALKWIKDNISASFSYIAFGGDQDRITIFGQSAGAASVGLHLLADQSQDLFNRAILMSGSMIHPWAVELDKEKARSDSYKVGENALCRNLKSDQDLVDCLRGKPARVVVTAVLTTLAQIISINIPFVPVVDGELLTENPRTLLDQGKFKQCSILTGATKDDGSLVAVIPFRSQLGVSDPYVNYTQFQYIVPAYTYVHNTPQVARAIEQEYVDWTRVDDESVNYFDTYIELITDEAFYCPCDDLVRQFTKRGNTVFKYLFNHLPSNSVFSAIPLPVSLWQWRRVAHFEDVPFLFGCPFRPTWSYNFTKEEEALSLNMMTYFSNFAKTGNPNIVDNDDIIPDQEVEWDEFELLGRTVMELKPSMETKQGFHEDQCQFWNRHVLDILTYTADLEKVQEEWQTEYDRWKSGDVIEWRRAFDRHKGTNKGHCNIV